MHNSPFGYHGNERGVSLVSLHVVQDSGCVRRRGHWWWVWLLCRAVAVTVPAAVSRVVLLVLVPLEREGNMADTAGLTPPTHMSAPLGR